MLQRLTTLGLLTVAACAAAPVASALADDAPPAITFSAGVIAVSGSTGADAFSFAAGDATHVVIESLVPFAPSDDGVCSASGNEAICAVAGPTDVVFDVSAGGGDQLNAGGRGAAVGSVTATYANALDAIYYEGGMYGSASTVWTVDGQPNTLVSLDRVVATPFSDFLVGGDTAETLVAGDGDDRIDVQTAGGPGDSVECGSGFDLIMWRSGTDTQTGCEVLNGYDITQEGGGVGGGGKGKF